MTSQVLTTVAMVVSAIKRDLKAANPTMSTVYDPSLDLQRAAGLARTDTNMQESSSKKTFPLLMYNRSVLRPAEPMGRTKNFTYEYEAIKAKLDVDKFKVFYGEFDFRFQYAAVNKHDIEEFEVEYIGRDGIQSIQHVTVDLTNIGLDKWQSHIHWNMALEDGMSNIDGVTYSLVGGSAKVYGWFILMKGKVPVITNINYKLSKSGTEELLDETNITA